MNSDMGCTTSTAAREALNQHLLMTCEDQNEMENLPVVDSRSFAWTHLISSGNFGDIYAAQLRANGEWFAIKELKKAELEKYRTAPAMMRNEISALKKIDHPFISNLQFAFQDHARACLAFDLCAGVDLKRHLKSGMRFNETDMAFYISSLASALDYIHAKNIIHRDVKLENVLLDMYGYVRLTDFGVAHVQSDFVKDRALVCRHVSGTVPYMAPEMHTYTHMHGPEVDFWALGLVAYELFYGRRPYRRRCPDTMIAFLNDAQGHFGVEVPPLPIEKQHKAPNRKALDSVSASTEFTFDDDADTEMFDFNEEPVLPNSSGLSALFQSVEDDCVPEFEEPYLFPCGGARPADNTPPLVYMSWNYPVHAGRKDELPPELRVSVPVHSEFLNDNICEEALDLMKGLLDPRPSMRLGGRNGHALRTHQWFEDCGVVDRRPMFDGSIIPRFDPMHPSNKLPQEPVSSKPRIRGERAPGIDVDELNSAWNEFNFVSPRYCEVLDELLAGDGMSVTNNNRIAYKQLSRLTSVTSASTATDMPGDLSPISKKGLHIHMKDGPVIPESITVAQPVYVTEAVDVKLIH